MLSLDDLISFGNQVNLPPQKRRGIVREYMQTLVLYYLQQTSFASNLVFIGGTALRFFHNLQRFSEDLDFNYIGVMNKKNIQKFMQYLLKEMEKENIQMEYSIRKSRETYFHWKVYMQFLNVLQVYKCSGRINTGLHPTEKFSIQLDILNLGKKKYPFIKNIISFFGKRFIFNTTDLNMFLAEKSNAIFFRKYPRGRDFFDWMSLIEWGAKIDFDYMRKREIIVKNKENYHEKIIKRVKKLDFKKLTKQLSPFLFRLEDQDIMKYFPDHVEQIIKKL